MKYEEFLQRVIDQGVAAASQSYENDGLKRRGALAGFRACEGKSVPELAKLLADATTSSRHREDLAIDDYWEAVTYEHEVEWVCNCVSAATGVRIGHPTARGAIRAAAILGGGALDRPIQDC